MMMSDTAAVPDAVVDEFERNGVVCLRGLFEQRWLNQLADGVEKNFAAPGPYQRVYTTPGNPGAFYDDYCNWQRIDEYRDFILHSPTAEIAARLMRSTTAINFALYGCRWRRCRSVRVRSLSPAPTRAAYCIIRACLPVTKITAKTRTDLNRCPTLTRIVNNTTFCPGILRPATASRFTCAQCTAHHPPPG